jgi:preprotein translocase subunit SecA
MPITIFKKLFGSDSDRYLAKIKPQIDKINSLEPTIAALTNDELRAQTAKFRQRLAAGETLDSILPEAFATVRETAKRVLGQRHYDVQLIGGLALHDGRIAEMKTGEGKTQVATLPAYLNALTGGVHIVTVNDYLARRDAVWMGQIYDFLGLSVSVLNNQVSYLYDASAVTKEDDAERDAEGSFRVIYEFLRPATRGEAYRADITYGTNNEFGFDYLRDNIAYRTEDVVQPMMGSGQFHYAIIDEVDSIMIDEARTPLIISAPAAKSEDLYRTFADIAAKLDRETDYTVDEKQKAISLTDEGITKTEKMLGVQDIYSEKGIKYVHHLETAVRAKALFELDRDYVVKNGEVIIVDEFTGRLQPGRRWSEGLHQAIEAKERVEVKEESRTFATITLQNYFRLYGKLAGMTGTAQTSAEEFMKVYGLAVLSVPTNRPSQRKDLNDLVFQTEHGKFLALARQVKERQVRGQPVLVGTASIEKNEVLSAYFKKAGIPHEVLNAKNHEREGAIIAAAGRKGAVVLATNMAGRGVDIKLGGPDATPAEREEIRQLGGLFVVGTERHEARRIDNQLRGRSGRQGDPGETQFFVSLEDTLMRVFANSGVKTMMGRLGIPEDEPIENRFVTRAIESAQTKIEGLNFDLRKHLLEYDDVMNHQRQAIYGRRRKILFGAAAEVDDFLRKTIESLISDPAEQEKANQLIEQKKQALGDGEFYQMIRPAILQIIDMYWVDHLEQLDYMRGSVRLRAYGQRDPLVEFKREGLQLFRNLESSIGNDILNFIENTRETGTASVLPAATELEEIHEGALSLTEDRHAESAKLEKIGRNDPCPCGAINPETGKVYKYKHCGLINAPQHKA